MNLIYTKSFDNTYKKLKRHLKENSNLNIIKSIFESSTDFNELKNNPLIKLYSFEQLRYQLNEFYSFNLDKSGGIIRLIVKPDEYNPQNIYLIFISYKHYDDFSKERVIYYDE